jgi:pilus assembly protein CpaF
MVNLSLTEKGGNTNELSFDKDEVTVGRVRGNDIVLPKGNVSKHHCRLIVRGDDVAVEDLRSTNGTYVNGRKIAEATPVSTTDKLFVGDFIIRVISSEPSLEGARSLPPPGPPEAGSLSSALPRRPPPPPPAARGGSGFSEGHGSAPKVASLRSPLPPPPPPPLFPAKRETKVVPEVAEPFPPPSGPSDINLDDEDDDLGTSRPRFTVPPLKPAVQPPGSMTETEVPHPRTFTIETPEPLREPAPADFATEGAAPPEPPASSDEDVVESQFGSPPESDGVFTSAAEKSHQAPATHETAKVRDHEPSKGKATMPKRAARALDRDVPEWLTQLLDGEGVTAAFITGTTQTEIQRHGRRESVSVPASDLAALGGAIRKLASKGSPKPTADAAAVTTTLPDGMQIAAIFPPVADRLCVAIRRPVHVGKTIDDLVADQVISGQMRQVLEACVLTRQNILVSGDHAACDHLLRAILWSVDRVARVALISDSITPPASATSWIKLLPEQHVFDLIGAAVAMQPEYLIVDAKHGELAGEVLSECNLGLDGVILSVVARSPHDALRRLQSLSSANGSPDTLGDMVAAGIDVLVHASVLPDGSLKVVEIAEPKTSLDGQISAHALLAWTPGDGTSGAFTATGAHSSLAAKLAAAGSTIPPEILNRQ